MYGLFQDLSKEKMASLMLPYLHGNLLEGYRILIGVPKEEVKTNA